MSISTNPQSQPLKADEALSQCSESLSVGISSPKSVSKAPSQRSALLNAELSLTAIVIGDESTNQTKHNTHDINEAYHDNIVKSTNCQSDYDPNDNTSDVAANENVKELNGYTATGKDVDNSLPIDESADVVVLARTNLPEPTAPLSAPPVSPDPAVDGDRAPVDTLTRHYARGVNDTAGINSPPPASSATSTNVNELATSSDGPAIATTSSSQTVPAKRRAQKDDEALKKSGLRRIRGQGRDSDAFKMLKQRKMTDIFRGRGLPPAAISAAGVISQVAIGVPQPAVLQAPAQTTTASTPNATNIQGTVIGGATVGAVNSQEDENIHSIPDSHLSSQPNDNGTRSLDGQNAMDVDEPSVDDNHMDVDVKVPNRPQDREDGNEGPIMYGGYPDSEFLVRDEQQMICKTNIIKFYRVRDEHLAHFNPVVDVATGRVTYKERDVELAVFQKHGGRNGFLKYLSELRNRWKRQQKKHDSKFNVPDAYVEALAAFLLEMEAHAQAHGGPGPAAGTPKPEDDVEGNNMVN